MRRSYSYQCQTCGMQVTLVWVSERPPTDEEIPMTMLCKNQACPGILNRARPVKTAGRVIGQGFLNHDADLVMVINPDLLTEAERQALRPDQAAIAIRIPGT